jgi:hypothetical protein
MSSSRPQGARGGGGGAGHARWAARQPAQDRVGRAGAERGGRKQAAAGLKGERERFSLFNFFLFSLLPTT